MTRYALKYKIIDDLNHYVWYEREKFDGNPNGRLLVERYEDDEDTQEALNQAINFLGKEYAKTKNHFNKRR